MAMATSQHGVDGYPLPLRRWASHRPGSGVSWRGLLQHGTPVVYPAVPKPPSGEFGALFFRQGRLRLLVICVFAGMGDANDNFEIADVVQKLVVEQAMVWPRSRVYYNAVVSTNR